MRLGCPSLQLCLAAVDTLVDMDQPSAILEGFAHDDSAARVAQRERILERVAEYESEHGPVLDAAVDAIAVRAASWPE